MHEYVYLTCLTFYLINWSNVIGLMLCSHQANAKAIFSLMFGVTSCIENNATHLFAMSLSRSLGVNEP